MAIRLVYVATVNIEVVVDQRDAARTSVVPAVISQHIDSLRATLPTPSRVWLKEPVAMTRRDDGTGPGGRRKRDKPATAEDTVLTPLEQEIARRSAADGGGQEGGSGQAESVSAMFDQWMSQVYTGFDPPIGDIIPQAEIDGDTIDLVGGDGDSLPGVDDTGFDGDGDYSTEDHDASDPDTVDYEEPAGSHDDPEPPKPIVQPTRGAVYRVGTDGSLIG